MCYLKAVNTPAHQLEAFNWWLDQDKQGRSAASLAARYGVSTRQADTWRAAFDRRLSATLQDAVSSKLKTYVAEYEQIQLSAIRQAQVLVAVTNREVEKLRVISENFGEIKANELGSLASSIKTVYSLAEAASGADIAKKRAVQKPVDSNGRLALPDMGALFDSARPVDSSAASNLATEIITVESESILEILNENITDSAASEEK